MKVWEGLYMPDEETHYIQWFKHTQKYVDGKPAYQYHKYEECLKVLQNKRNAIDIGGNLGFWSRVMCLDFNRVEAFEPVQLYADIFKLNAPDANLHVLALSDEEQVINMVCEEADTCGNTRVEVLKKRGKLREKSIQEAIAVTLDSFGFTEVDFIKIDCEGYEYPILMGAEQTILANKPVIIVEQKPNKGNTFGYAEDKAVQYLISLGMKTHKVISGDYIMVW